MPDRITNVANFARTVLASEMGGADLVANVASTSRFPASPCILSIEPASNERREIIHFDGAFTATSFSVTDISRRYQEGSADGPITHPSGSDVICAPLAQHLEDVITAVFEGEPGDLASTGTVNLDFYGPWYRNQTLSGNVTYTTSNLKPGRSLTVRVYSPSTRDLTFPSGWKFLGVVPMSIEGGRTGVLTVTSFGSTDADCVAAWAATV